jgi:hypothetical protein
MEMLYQERVLGRRTLWNLLRAPFARRSAERRYADVDLVALTPHLRRDLGLDDGQSGLSIR